MFKPFSPLEQVRHVIEAIGFDLLHLVQQDFRPFERLLVADEHRGLVISTVLLGHVHIGLHHGGVGGGGNAPDVAFRRGSLSTSGYRRAGCIWCAAPWPAGSASFSESGPRNVLASTMNGPSFLVSSHGSIGSLGRAIGWRLELISRRGLRQQRSTGVDLGVSRSDATGIPRVRGRAGGAGRLGTGRAENGRSRLRTAGHGCRVLGPGGSGRKTSKNGQCGD